MDQSEILGSKSNLSSLSATPKSPKGDLNTLHIKPLFGSPPWGSQRGKQRRERKIHRNFVFI